MRGGEKGGVEWSGVEREGGNWWWEESVGGSDDGIGDGIGDGVSCGVVMVVVGGSDDNNDGDDNSYNLPLTFHSTIPSIPLNGNPSPNGS